MQNVDMCPRLDPPGAAFADGGGNAYLFHLLGAQLPPRSGLTKWHVQASSGASDLCGLVDS